MVTFAQAQERAEEWINADVPAYQHREVRVREFGLGFVLWAEDREGGPVSGGGKQRMVIARDSGEATLWPGLPVGEVIRRYEQEYGAPEETSGGSSVPPQRIDSEQTSFLLSPPEWLRDPDAGPRPEPQASAAGSVAAGDPTPAPQASGLGAPLDPPSGTADRTSVLGPPAPARSPASSGPSVPARPPAAAGPEEPTAPLGAAPVSSRPGSPAQPEATPWAGTDTNGLGDEDSVPLPATVFAPPLSGSDADDTPRPGVAPEAETRLMAGGSQLPPTAVAPALGVRAVEVSDERAGRPAAPAGADVGTPPPPGAPGRPASHQADTVLAAPVMPQPPGPPGAATTGRAPQPPGPPGAPRKVPSVRGSEEVHQAETVLGGPVVGPNAAGVPGPPPPPGPVGAPGAAAPRPQVPGVPTVGPGYQAVLRYRAADGSEQQVIRRSAPGTPHPEWQILYELRALNVPPQRVLELHTELASCELPGGYCARMIRETWPQVRITNVAPYGTDHASRQQGVRHLLTHQGELHQVAGGPARPAPVRAALPPTQTLPAIPLEAIAQELTDAFGLQGVFRFDQRAVSRQGVPEIVATTLVQAGLPTDFGPFFWAQAVPGQPVPTLAELALQRQLQPASDASSYLVVGSDFGKALCVQYGTANIVAVPVEGGPGGAPVPPQFVNSSLPQFARSMAMLGRMWRLRLHLTPEQAGRWTVDFQAQLAALDGAALSSPDSWWSVLLEQMWDGLL
ncbi:SUKH-4 family immunity protein [Streptomyces sp. NPDC006879]|uniref:SUKH-4 family immunity protein n=1 Tax=Streptomyces sp. NPDC006879 TaxID=3364767 RepID=UPI0036BD4367